MRDADWIEPVARDDFLRLAGAVPRELRAARAGSLVVILQLEVVRVLKPTGTGKIIIPNDVIPTPTIYTNSGVKMNVVDEHHLDLSSGTEVTNQTGYSFTGNNTDGYILTLNNLVINSYSIHYTKLYEDMLPLIPRGAVPVKIS